VRLNFVFFTDSVSELYGQRMYVCCMSCYLKISFSKFTILNSPVTCVCLLRLSTTGTSFIHLFRFLTTSRPLLATPLFYFFPNTTCHTRFLPHLVFTFQYSFNKLFSDFHLTIICLSFSHNHSLIITN
jgi:hypothetical protein